MVSMEEYERLRSAFYDERNYRMRLEEEVRGERRREEDMERRVHGVMN